MGISILGIDLNLFPKAVNCLVIFTLRPQRASEIVIGERIPWVDFDRIAQGLNCFLSAAQTQIGASEVIPRAPEFWLDDEQFFVSLSRLVAFSAVKCAQRRIIT